MKKWVERERERSKKKKKLMLMIGELKRESPHNCGLEDFVHKQGKQEGRKKKSGDSWARAQRGRIAMNLCTFFK